ncbi:unnamed protein product [Brassica rapa subsp. trilocularis]
MDPFHLPLPLSIYKSLLLACVSIKIEKLLSNNHPDGTQRKHFNLQRPQDQQEDRRLPLSHAVLSRIESRSRLSLLSSVARFLLEAVNA